MKTILISIVIKKKVMFNVRIDDDVIEIVTHRIAILDI